MLALFAAAMWFAWLGWDQEYYLVDGVAQGPYRAWQVLGCGLSISAAAVLAYLWAPSVWAVFVLAAAADLGFAVAWSRDAASTDDSGAEPEVSHTPRPPVLGVRAKERGDGSESAAR